VQRTSAGPKPRVRLVSDGPGAFIRRLGAAAIPFAIWTGYFLAFAGHIVFRAAGDEVFPWRDLSVTETALAGRSFSGVLQARFHGDGSFLLDRIATGVHLVWFAFPIVVGATITARRRHLLFEYLLWLTACWYFADIAFMVLPAAPPWMADSSVQRILFERGWIGDTVRDSNLVASLPSLHATIPMAVALFLRVRVPEARWAALVSAGFGLAVGLAVVYLGEHWVVDVMAGWVLAAVVAWLFVSPRVRMVLHRVPGDPLRHLQDLDARIAAVWRGAPDRNPAPAAPDELPRAA
jgi:membrane-associated phospholipid phosphatase